MKKIHCARSCYCGNYLNAQTNPPNHIAKYSPLSIETVKYTVLEKSRRKIIIYIMIKVFQIGTLDMIIQKFH